MSRQDRQGVRTATDLERKYNFGKSFEEVMSAARVAEKTAVKAQETADEAKEAVKGTHSEILKLSDSITLSVTNGEPGGTALIKLKVDDKEYTGEIDLQGVVTFTNLREQGQTVINGDNITTGTILADLIKAGVIKSVDGKSLIIDLDNGTLDAIGSFRTRVVTENIDESTEIVRYAEMGLDGFEVNAERRKYNDDGQTFVKYDLPNFLKMGELNLANRKGTLTAFCGYADDDESYVLLQELGRNNNRIQAVVQADRAYIYGLTAPVYAKDAVNKEYVDSTFVAMEHKEITLGGKTSGTLEFSGEVEAVSVTIQMANADSNCISGFWTKATSGITSSMYGRLHTTSASSWNTTVTIDGSSVTVTREGTDTLIHYVTAFIKQ